METTVSKTIWKLDPTHSEILFKVKHLMITNVKGEFRAFDAEIVSEGDDFSNAKIKATIDAGSVFTNNKDRDAHLKNGDFFDTEKHNHLQFESTEVKKIDDENYQVKGDLSIKDKTNEVILNVEFGGTAKDPYGNEKTGFSITGKLNRKNWGLNYNAALETGGIMIGEEVKLMIETQFVKQ